MIRDNTQYPAKRIASFCSYTPDEILYAAGLSPFRMVGNGKPAGKSRSFFPTYMCSYAMNCLDVLFENQMRIAGMAFVNSCHAMEILYETVREFIPHIPSFLINVPRQYSELALEYFCSELQRFRNALENTYKVEISHEKLKEAIKIYNYKRELRGKLEQLITRHDIMLSADEIRRLNRKSSASPEDFIEYAEALLAAADTGRQPVENSRPAPRILLAGSVYAPWDIAHIIEEYGGWVVACDHCTGLRSMIHQVEENSEPVRAIAKRYLTRPACARYGDAGKRIDELNQYLDSYKVDAVIFSILKFCPDQSYGLITMTEFLKEKKIPFLVIDSEYSDIGPGQIHTRIQAFLERL